MKPYYERKGVTLFCADCIDVLPTLATVDLLITDPPYGQSYQSGLRNARKQDKYAILANDTPADRKFVEWGLKRAYRVLRECRHAYVFGPFDLRALGFGGVQELIWDKRQFGGGNLSSPFGTSHEKIMFGVRVASAANRTDGYGNAAARLRKQSVLSFPRLHGVTLTHPTQKPVLLLRELVESSSRIGERVLDPFCGTGSTLVAAFREGRHAIGIELSEPFCERVAKRLEAEPVFQLED